MRTVIVTLCLSLAAPAHAFDVNDALTQIANKYQVNVATVKAIAEVESGTRCGIRTGSGKGIMQVQHGAAKSVGGPWPFKNCNDEIEAGVKYLRLAIDKAGDNCAAYTLYNSGINARIHCSAYGRKVQRARHKYERN